MYFGLGHMGAGFGRLGSASSTPGVSLTAPVLDWDNDTTDNTPDFIADLTGAIVDDDIVLEWDNDIDFSSPISTSANIVDAGEALALSVAFAVGALADGTYYFRAKHGRGGSYSDWSNIETVTIAVPAASATYHYLMFG